MKRILLIDDEVDIVDMLEMRFKENGFEVLTAHDGQEGLNSAKENLPDIIIVDEMMPKMDGYKVSGLLKNDTRFNKIPIIMFTARAEELDQNVSKEVGINAYMTKLSDFEELLKTVNSLLGEN